MSEFIELLENAAKGSAVSGARRENFQKYVRKMISDSRDWEETSKDIAGLVSQWRNAPRCTDDHVPEKVINNIINDVSRICRTTMGYSIVCKKKKPEYVYVAKVWERKPPTPSYTVVFPSTTSSLEVFVPPPDALAVASFSAVVERIASYLQMHPASRNEYCVGFTQKVKDIDGVLEALAKAIIAVKREKRDSE